MADNRIASFQLRIILVCSFIVSVVQNVSYAWVQRKLSSLVDFSNGINAPKEQYGKGRKMISVMDILAKEPIQYSSIKNAVEVDEKMEQNYRVEEGDLIFVRSSEVVNEVGWVKAYTDTAYALFSGFSIRGKKKTQFDNFFIELSLNFKNRAQIESKAGGSTRFNVSQIILNSVDLLQPYCEEQATISHFFRTLDDAITLHKRKLEGLKKLKSGYLQVMFPQNEERTPKVRFEGFNGEWEQRHLGEVSEIAGGGTPSTGSVEYWNGDIDWYAPAEIGERIFLNGSQRKITELGLKASSARILPVGTVLFTSRAGIGKSAILMKAGTTNQGFQSIVPHEGKLDSYFIFSRTQELKKYGETVGAGSTFVEVSGKQMSRMPMLIPQREEQVAIGTFFRSLDAQIATESAKLEQLKQLKSAYLQRMFV